MSEYSRDQHPGEVPTTGMADIRGKIDHYGISSKYYLLRECRISGPVLLQREKLMPETYSVL